jgi:hypothetical protein
VTSLSFCPAARARSCNVSMYSAVRSDNERGLREEFNGSVDKDEVNGGGNGEFVLLVLCRRRGRMWSWHWPHTMRGGRRGSRCIFGVCSRSRTAGSVVIDQSGRWENFRSAGGQSMNLIDHGMLEVPDTISVTTYNGRTYRIRLIPLRRQQAKKNGGGIIPVESRWISSQLFVRYSGSGGAFLCEGEILGD